MTIEDTAILVQWIAKRKLKEVSRYYAGKDEPDKFNKMSPAAQTLAFSRYFQGGRHELKKSAKAIELADQGKFKEAAKFLEDRIKTTSIDAIKKRLELEADYLKKLWENQ